MISQLSFVCFLLVALFATLAVAQAASIQMQNAGASMAALARETSRANGNVDGMIYAFTYNLEGKNHSAYVWDPRTSQIVATRPWGTAVFQYTGGVVDIKNRQRILVSNSEYVFVDMDNFLITGRLPTGSPEPTDIQFDQKSGKMYGIFQGDHNTIQAVDPATGWKKEILQFDDEIGVYLGMSTYGNGKYFVQGSVERDQNNIYVFDVNTKQQVDTWAIGTETYEGLSYDIQNDVLVGISSNNHTLVLIDPKSGKTATVPVAVPRGTPFLYDYIAWDGNYFVSLQYLSDYSFWWVDFKNGRTVANPTTYNEFWQMAYLPSKSRL